MLDLKSSVHKTFAILDYFTPEKPEWGVTELAKEIGTNKSNVHRFLSQMEAIEVLYKDEERDKYRLGIKLFELGNRVQINNAFVKHSHPALIEVAKNITETVLIGLLKNDSVFYIDKVESPQGLKISTQIGDYSPLYSKSIGKILLAYLSEEEQERLLFQIYNENIPTTFTNHTLTSKEGMKKELMEVKRKGYAIEKEESEIGLICVAIPIFNQNQEVVASLSADGPANRFQSEKVKDYVSILQKGAENIQNKIGKFKQP